MVMPCRNPWIKQPGGTSIANFVFSKEMKDAVTPFPCGNCMPCRINRSREWTHRILLEAKTHDENSFLTLTYTDEKLTRDDNFIAQVDADDLTKFLKKMRKHFGEFRYFAVGEYGTDFGRPHWHLMLFGVAWTQKNENLIEKIWGMGWASLGDVNETTARYITGYCLKKLTQEGDEKLYGKRPEIMRSSRGTRTNGKGGLGREAVREIAERIKSVDHYVPRVIREIRCEGRLYPLGRYLTRKLADDLGVTDEQFRSDVERYQYEIFLSYCNSNDIYIEAIKKDGEGKAQSMETKQKIWNSKRRLK